MPTISFIRFFSSILSVMALYAFTIFLPKGTDRNIVDFYDWLIYEMSNNASAIEAAKNIGNTLMNWLPSKQNEQSFAKYAETYADIAKTLE